MESKMDKDFDQLPLAQSSVTLKLADIQKRCTQLLDEPDELTLEEPQPEPIEDGPYDPYDRG